jgi:predicted helicase
MSKIAINQYYKSLERAIQFGKTKNETSVRIAFQNLINDYARKLNYELVAEIYVQGTTGRNVRPDGALKNLWGLDMGLWESKDEKDDIYEEIANKTKKGYPLTNILFEDTNVAVLYQNDKEVCKADMKNDAELDKILTQFINFKSKAIYDFEIAIEKFKADIPNIVGKLRQTIAERKAENSEFEKIQSIFWALCQAEINPNISLEDIREMMIQHILTSDIFNKIFGDSDFHRHNTIASELEKLTNALLDHSQRRNLLRSIEHYYLAINVTASAIVDHHEKQKFLKVLYENFYKVYNPKAADRLGVVYRIERKTPIPLG